MTFASQTALCTRRKLLEFVRQPTWVFVGLSTPLLYLALFGPLLERLAGGPAFASGDVLDVFVPGILVLVAFANGMGAGWITIWELDSGVIERLGVTPVSRLALVLGTSIRDALTFVMAGVLVIAVAIPFGYHPAAGGSTVMLGLLALVTMAVSAWSGALGMLLRQIGSLAAVVTGLQLPLTLLSGVLLPLSLAPDWMVVLAHANPLYYAVEASRDLSGGAIATAMVGEAFLVVGVTAVAATWWATRVYTRALA